VIGRLADRSMLSVETAEDGATRYRLLDSIRAFARTRLEEAGLAGDAAAAHTAWFAEAADRCAATVRSRAQPECLALVRGERANIDAALAWAAGHDPRQGLRLANGFGWTWVVLGDGVAGAARVRAPPSRRPGATPPPTSGQPACCWSAGWKRRPATSRRPRATWTPPSPPPRGSATAAWPPTPGGTWRSSASSRDAPSRS
jgi:hypothetical protein